MNLPTQLTGRPKFEELKSRIIAALSSRFSNIEKKFAGNIGMPDNKSISFEFLKFLKGQIPFSELEAGIRTNSVERNGIFSIINNSGEEYYINYFINKSGIGYIKMHNRSLEFSLSGALSHDDNGNLVLLKPVIDYKNYVYGLQDYPREYSLQLFWTLEEGIVPLLFKAFNVLVQIEAKYYLNDEGEICFDSKNCKLYARDRDEHLLVNGQALYYLSSLPFGTLRIFSQKRGIIDVEIAEDGNGNILIKDTEGEHEIVIPLKFNVANLDMFSGNIEGLKLLD